MMQVLMLSVAIFISRLRGFLLGFAAALLDQKRLLKGFFAVGLQELVLSSLSIRSKLGPNAALLDQVGLVVACFSSSSGIG